MNTCIKCGKEIPEGELFCKECSMTPERPVAQPKTQQKPKAASAPQQSKKTATPAPANKTRVPQDTIRLDPIRQKKPLGLIVALVIVALIAAGAIGMYVNARSEMTKLNNQLRSAQADAQRVQSGSTSLEDQLADAQQEIETLEYEKAQLNNEIANLNSQLSGQANKSNQDAYDSTALQQTNQRLTQQVEELSDQLSEAQRSLSSANEQLQTLNETMEEKDTALEEKDEEIETLKEEREEMEEEYTEYLKKSDFMDKFVVFVENDGTDLYHSYGCSDFKKKDFWVFNPSYARDQGYEPCEKCQENSRNSQ